MAKITESGIAETISGGNVDGMCIHIDDGDANYFMGWYDIVFKCDCLTREDAIVTYRIYAFIDRMDPYLLKAKHLLTSSDEDFEAPPGMSHLSRILWHAGKYTDACRMVKKYLSEWNAVHARKFEIEEAELEIEY